MFVFFLILRLICASADSMATRPRSEHSLSAIKSLFRIIGVAAKIAGLMRMWMAATCHCVKSRNDIRDNFQGSSDDGREHDQIQSAPLDCYLKSFREAALGSHSPALIPT